MTPLAAIAGAAATATQYQEANTVPPFTPPLAPGLVATPTNLVHEPRLNPNPVRVHDHNAQSGVPDTTTVVLNTENDALPRSL